jgi:2-dehydropantoate 2-reductase
MRIAIAGAGAVGSVIAAYLGRAGHDVSLLARGPHLAAIRRDGLVHHAPDGVFRSRPEASDRGAALGLQDAVICAAKAHSLPAMAADIAAMTGPDTLLVAAQNGIPWWYFHGLPGPDGGQPLPVVDPGGVLWRTLGPERSVGAVIVLPAHLPEPGVVAHSAWQTLILGAPRPGDHAAALAALAAALESGGMQAPVVDDIRTEIWRKLWTNVAFGPTSMLGLAAMDRLIAAPGMADLTRRLAAETRAVAAAWGCPLADEVEATMARMGRLTSRPSMLQDLEAGRPMELDAILAAPVELAHRRGVAVPILESVLALARLRAAAQP